jgi:hypothetical protein
MRNVRQGVDGALDAAYPPRHAVRACSPGNAEAAWLA